MRWVAGKAPLFAGDRGMLECYVLTFFLMTIKTEKIPSLSKKIQILRSMGSVTGNTFSFFKRAMFYTSTGFQFRGVVTIVTKFATCFIGSERFGI
jgi:hypothetical protein